MSKKNVAENLKNALNKKTATPAPKAAPAPAAVPKESAEAKMKRLEAEKKALAAEVKAEKKAAKVARASIPTRPQLAALVILENPEITDTETLVDLVAKKGEEYGITANDDESRKYHLPRAKAILAVYREFHSIKA